jgi:hypothetical protein
MTPKREKKVRVICYTNDVQEGISDESIDPSKPQPPRPSRRTLDRDRQTRDTIRALETSIPQARCKVQRS